MQRLRINFILPAVGWLLLAADLAIASGPVAVSPGKLQETVLINETCPTFSWTSVDGAEAYELVAWLLSKDTDESTGAEDSAEPEAVIEETLPRGAQAWTPSLGRCLTRGGRYAWAVQAIGGEDGGEWSEPSLFTVAAGPTESEFQEALAIVREYLKTARTPAVSRPSGNLSPSAAEDTTSRRATTARGSVPTKAAMAFSVDGSGNINVESIIDADGSAFFDGACGDNQHLTGISNNGAIICGSDSGDISQVDVGTGLIGGGDTGSVTLAADTEFLQRRVSGSCPAGSSIRIIDSGGSVTCESDDTGGDNLGNHTVTQNLNLNGNYLSGDTDNEGIWIDNNGGKVGINKLLPAEQLHVAGNIRLDSGGVIGFGSSTIGISEIAGNIDVDANEVRLNANTQDIELNAFDDIFLLPDDDLRIEPLGVVRVEGTGVKMGISEGGLSSPTHLLHVNGVARSTQSTWATSSDGRVKTNVRPLSGSLEKIQGLRPVSFEYAEEYRGTNKAMAGRKVGFIAQEVARVDPSMVSLVTEVVGGQTIDDFHMLSVGNLIPMLVDAVQELTALNNALLKRNDELAASLCRDRSEADLCHSSQEVRAIRGGSSGVGH